MFFAAATSTSLEVPRFILTLTCRGLVTTGNVGQMSKQVDIITRIFRLLLTMIAIGWLFLPNSAYSSEFSVVQMFGGKDEIRGTDPGPTNRRVWTTAREFNIDG